MTKSRPARSDKYRKQLCPKFYGNVKSNSHSRIVWPKTTKSRRWSLAGIGTRPPKVVRMIERAHTRLTEEQYFAFCDRHADERWELIEGLLWPHPDYAGSPFGFAGPTRGHQAIVRNIVRALEAGLASPCRAEENLSVRVPAGGLTFRQPDVLVSRDAFAAEQRFVDTPLVAIEVLSETTAAVDLLDKPLEYARLPSIELYIVVDSRRRRAFAYRRAEGFLQVAIDEFVEVHGALLSLDQIYAGLPL